MKKPLLYAMAATLLAGSGVQAQDEMMMTPAAPPFSIGVYGGLAWSSPWATLGTVGGTRPITTTQNISPGLAPMFGGIANFNLFRLGLRLHYGYMPAAIRGTEDAWEFPDDYPLNNHFYDLSFVFRPFAARGPGLMGSTYVFLGGGGLTSDYADGARTCPEGGVVQGINQRGVLLFCNPSPSTVGQGTAGIGADLFSFFGLGIFGEIAAHVYDSPIHVRAGGNNQAGPGGAQDKYAVTPAVKLGLMFAPFGARAPAPPPPPPPPPPMVEAPLPPPPAETPIRVCVLEAGQLREVDAVVVGTDTMVVVGAERRRFTEAFPATTGYAGGADFFVQDRPIRFGGRNYVRFGLTRIIPPTDVRPIGEFQGATLFAETGANQQRPDVLYVLVRPGCEFQPYQPQARITPRG